VVNDYLGLPWSQRFVRRRISGSPELFHDLPTLFQHPGEGFHRTRVNPFAHVHPGEEGLGDTPLDFYFHKIVFEINE